MLEVVLQLELLYRDLIGFIQVEKSNHTQVMRRLHLGVKKWTRHAKGWLPYLVLRQARCILARLPVKIRMYWLKHLKI